MLIDLLMRGEKKKKKKENLDPDHLKQNVGCSWSQRLRPGKVFLLGGSNF